MPAYNEAGCIEASVLQWLELGRSLFQQQFKLIVVNDGSKDDTGAILDRISTQNLELEVIHQKNGGHGAALMTAYRRALSHSTEFVFHVDSDDQFLTSDFSKLWAKRKTSNFILGMREQRQDPFHRLIITKILRILLWIVFGAWIQDSNIPYRLMEAHYLRRLLTIVPKNVFAPNIFLAVAAVKLGEPTLDIPVGHKARNTGQVSIMRWNLMKVCIRSARELMQFKKSLWADMKRAAAKAQSV